MVDWFVMHERFENRSDIVDWLENLSALEQKLAREWPLGAEVWDTSPNAPNKVYYVVGYNSRGLLLVSPVSFGFRTEDEILASQVRVDPKKLKRIVAARAGMA